MACSGSHPAVGVRGHACGPCLQTGAACHHFKRPAAVTPLHPVAEEQITLFHVGQGLRLPLPAVSFHRNLI